MREEHLVFMFDSSWGFLIHSIIGKCRDCFRIQDAIYEFLRDWDNQEDFLWWLILWDTLFLPTMKQA